MFISTVILFNYFFLVFSYIPILADANRVPYDLPEAESEPIAGSITEYSTIYSSSLLLTEYGNIIALFYSVILIYSIYPLPLAFFLFFACMIRSTSNRLKFDESMTSARLVISPIIFPSLSISLTYNSSFILLYNYLIVNFSSTNYQSFPFIYPLSLPSINYFAIPGQIDSNQLTYHYLLTTNHIYIGAIHIMSGLIGGSIGFGLSILSRSELALPGSMLRPSPQYNPNITSHGIFMIPSMIMPVLIGGSGNILSPSMLCSSDMISPRLNALSLWLVFNSLVIMFLAMFIDGGVNAGRTSHAPSSTLNYSSVDLMFFSSHTVGLSSLLGSINSIVTSLKSSSISIIHSFLFLPPLISQYS